MLRRRLLALALVAEALTACTVRAPRLPEAPVQEAHQAAAARPIVHVDPAAVHADELGRIPVLMYHRVVDDPKAPYDTTPARFRAELSLLYRSGYRTITASDLVSGRIDVPAGTSPVVLTFDDSSASQYREVRGGRVDPRSAVGILLAVGRRYEPHPVATFYVNARPFGNHPAYLRKLADLGMELGDHTASHADLSRLDAAGVQRELRAGLAVIRSAVPGASVTTMALPYGEHPVDHALAHRGRGYDLKAVLLVGAGPARSPYSRLWRPYEVPRIRSGPGEFGSTYWLARLRRTRYISDGDPSVVSFPRARATDLAPRLRSRMRPY